jgi:hypothetical protein
LRLLPSVGRKAPDKYFLFGIEHVSAKHELMRTDPSESVCSADILPIFRARFSEREVHPYGDSMIVHGLDWIFYSHFSVILFANGALEGDSGGQKLAYIYFEESQDGDQRRMVLDSHQIEILG